MRFSSSFGFCIEGTKPRQEAVFLLIVILFTNHVYAEPLIHQHHTAPSHVEHDLAKTGTQSIHQHHHIKSDPKLFTSHEHAVTKTSKSGKFKVSLYSNEAPIPLQKIHTWTLKVVDVNGAPFEGKVYVNGGMPMHQHGFPTKPLVKEYLGDGKYSVRGIKFNMHGEWDLRFNIQDGRYTDRVVFKVNLQNKAKLVASDEWNEFELATLQALWIDNLTLPNSPSNRVADNYDAAEFGHKIFFDQRFSLNGQISCASCHDPNRYFTDGLTVSTGIGTVTRNAPTIVGAGFDAWLFRDGRADSLWSQALGPLEDRQEHGGSRTQYAHIIYNDPEYRMSYEKLFGPMPNLADHKRFPKKAGPVFDKELLTAWRSMTPSDQEAITTVFVNIGKVLEAYERQLKPAPSRFDNYVATVIDGDQKKIKNLLSEDELAGLKLFISKANCTICHNGPLFTDHSFHNIGTPPRSVKRYDWGRYKAVNRIKRSEFNCRGKYNDSEDQLCPELDYLVVHKEETAAAFKTPSLRNVSKTAPFMHAGQYQSLTEVLNHYADPPETKVGMSDLIPVKLSLQEQSQLIAFLKTLESPIRTKLGIGTK